MFCEDVGDKGGDYFVILALIYIYIYITINVYIDETVILMNMYYQ